MRLKILPLCAVLAFGAVVASPPLLAQFGLGIQLNFAPPPVQIETVPPPRPGFVWGRGYWQWQGGQHVWVPGRWIAEHPGQHWVPEHWAQNGPNWVFVPGAWVNVDSDVVVGVPPPPPEEEPVPPNAPGYIWVRGHWFWGGQGFAWIGGRWEPNKPGWVWVNPHWRPEGADHWRFLKGHWE
jgi:hypothetical protein